MIAKLREDKTELRRLDEERAEIFFYTRSHGLAARTMTTAARTMKNDAEFRAWAGAWARAGLDLYLRDHAWRP